VAGNSGGPVMNARVHKCLGVAFASYSSSDDVQNVGLVIPTLIVRRFIKDYMRFKAFQGLVGH
jgi:S1-C subfamily serine protease